MANGLVYPSVKELIGFNVLSLGSGSRMVKSGRSPDKYEIVSEEVGRFLKLIGGHRRILFAIGEL